MASSTVKFVRQYEPGNQARVELVNGRIVDVVNGRYHGAETRVVLQGGVIVSMPGLPGEPAAVEADYTIDLQGKTVLPGLFNTHCHLMSAGPTMVFGLSDMRRAKRYREQQLAKNLADCLAHGVTYVRDAWEADLNENRALKERISKGELPGPRIQQSVLVGPTGSYMQEKLPLAAKVFMPQADPSKDDAGTVTFPTDATERQVRDAVDRAIDERGAETIKIGEQTPSLFSGKPLPVMTFEQLNAVADQARRRGVQSTMHHTSVESFRRGIEAGVSSLAHVPWDAPLPLEDVQAFKASGCLIDPTVSVFYTNWSWQTAGDRSNGHPELTRLTAFRDRTCTFAAIADEYHVPELRASVMNGYKRCAGGKPKTFGIVDMSGMIAWDTKAVLGFENLRLLAEHGAPMTTGNDSIPPCTPAMMGLELLMMDHVLKGNPDRAPLGGADAVRIATINSARSLGVEGTFGSIECGKTADLVILDGDPLQDFRVIGSRVAALFVEGRLAINECGLSIEPLGKRV